MQQPINGVETSRKWTECRHTRLYNGAYEGPDVRVRL